MQECIKSLAAGRRECWYGVYSTAQVDYRELPVLEKGSDGKGEGRSCDTRQDQVGSAPSSLGRQRAVRLGWSTP